MIYRFRRDRFVLVGTVFGIVVMWGVFFYIAFFGNAPIWGLIAIGAIFALLCATGLRTPRYTYIEKDLIVVKRYVGRTVLENIQSIVPLNRKELFMMERLFGNSGFFGYTGLYAYVEKEDRKGSFFRRLAWKDLKVHLLAVNMNELALVTLANGKKYVINYPQELLENKQGNRDFA